MGLTNLRSARRRGLTLYEVFLALTLLLGAMAVLSQHIAVGTRAGVRGRLQTTAAMHCQTKLAEIIGGIEPMTPVSNMPVSEVNDGWTWSLEIAPGPATDLLNLVVSVAHKNSFEEVDASFTLRRLVRDPQALLDIEAAAAEAAAASSSTETAQ